MKKAIILAGGNIISIEKIWPYIDCDTDIVCVDGGCDYAIDNSLNISIAIGDFDSISENKYQTIKDKDIKRITFNVDKDKTDMQLAIEYCIDCKYDNLHIFGGLGTRMDHSMANISFLDRFHDNFKELTIVDETNIIFSCKDEAIINNKEGYYLSFIIASGEPIIDIEGVKWPLRGHKMIPGDSYTISNKIVSESARVVVKEGSCYVFLSKD